MKADKINIYSLLDNLRIRKGMYLGNDYNFSSLKSFLSGFMMASSEDQLKLDNYPNFEYFNIWLLGHLNSHFGLGGDWYWQISNRNPNDDEKHFEEFFIFLEKFKSSKVKKKLLIVDIDFIKIKNQNYVRMYKSADGNTIHLNDIPSKIIWTTIENSTTIWTDFYNSDDEEIFGEIWHINADNAIKALESEFGQLKINKSELC